MRSSARYPSISGLILIALFFSFRIHAQQVSGTQQVTIPSGVPLHIRVTRTASLRKGAQVEGLLTEPVYVFDRLVLPGNAVVRGSVSEVARPSGRFAWSLCLTAT
jgi:hypothetical protein